MKILTTVSAITMMMIVYSCQPKNEPCPEVPEKHPNGLFELTTSQSIDRVTFDTYVAAWDANFRTYMANDSVHYFDLPLADLTAVLQNRNLDGSRVYMGMKNDANGVLRPNLMIVGTIAGQSQFGTIMDYTKVCPVHCPQH